MVDHFPSVPAPSSSPSSSPHHSGREDWAVAQPISRSAQSIRHSRAHRTPIVFASLFLSLTAVLHSLRHSGALDASSSASAAAAAAAQHPLPPLYISLSGRTACSDPIQTSYTAAPLPVIWRFHWHIKRFFKLFPFTALKVYEIEHKDAHFESRDFELVPSTSAQLQQQSAAASSSNVAGASTVATAAAPAPSSAPISVFIPSSLPAEPSYLHGLIRQVSDVTRDVTLSSTTFMEQLSSGLLQVQERNIEKVIAVGQRATIVGWVHRDPTSGSIAVIEGGGATPAAAGAASSASSSSSSNGGSSGNGIAAAVPLSLSDHPDLQAYSYSSNSHPCIISHKSHSRILEDEARCVASNRRWLIAAVGVTLVVGVALAARYLYRSYEKNQQLKRLVFFHDLRRERRAQQRRDKKEREKRRALKRRAQARELAAHQAAYNAAVAAAAMANTQTTDAYNSYGAAGPQVLLPQQEGVPQYAPATPSPQPNRHYAPAPLARGAHSPAPMHPASPSYAAHINSSSSSSSQLHYSRAQQGAATPSLRSPSPYSAAHSADAGEGSAPHTPAHLRRQSSHPLHSSSASSAPSLSAHMQPLPLPLDDERVSSSDSDVDVSDSSDDPAPEDDGADDCVICAEHKADACLVQCGHMVRLITAAARN